MQKSLGEDITNELEQFVKYMEDEDIDSYASSCLDQGYKNSRNGIIFMANKVADRIMCTLMSGALFFMNGWGTHVRHRDHTDLKDEELKAHIRCAIVNIFMNILLASKCRSQFGINHAWYTMKETEPDFGGGLITDGTCGQGVFADIQINDFHMETMIQTWLENKQSLTDNFAGPEIQSTCRKPLGARVGGTIDAHTMDENTDLRPEEKDAIRTLGQALKTIVEEVQKEVVKCAEDNGACMQSIDAVTGRNREGDDSEASAPNSVASATPAPNEPPGAAAKPVATKPEVPPAKVPEVPKEVVPENKPSEAGAGTDGRGRSEESATGPVPQPPPAEPPSTPSSPPAPPAGNTHVGRAHKRGPEDGAPAGSARGGQPSSTSQDPATSGTGPAVTHTDNTGKCTSTTAVHVAKNAGKGIQGASSTTTLSFVSSPDANNECEKKSKDSGPGSVLSAFRQQQQKEKKRNNNFRRDRERHHGDRGREKPNVE
ncbi:hypothetical protein AK88_04982 [Plasmodium fragile]|uniref:Schizont-infected cell agglutination extracellular alpha domain-containing protein n=1 Tax=Plasmodium fragile TaxID=5857 RepID=A0A0D9QEY6_PLAFR|nr:uncharacterized protein AK88_04982 [Plasmodium fragile]KJP85382.1 hypothetical protein AK88_04982 [Plasmodium fragile]